MYKGCLGSKVLYHRRTSGGWRQRQRLRSKASLLLRYEARRVVRYAGRRSWASSIKSPAPSALSCTARRKYQPHNGASWSGPWVPK